MQIQQNKKSYMSGVVKKEWSWKDLRFDENHRLNTDRSIEIKSISWWGRDHHSFSHSTNIFEYLEYFRSKSPCPQGETTLTGCTLSNDLLFLSLSYFIYNTGVKIVLCSEHSLSYPGLLGFLLPTLWDPPPGSAYFAAKDYQLFRLSWTTVFVLVV